MQVGSFGGTSSNPEARIVPKQVDFVGLAIYGGVIVTCLLFLVYTEAIKWWRRRKHGDPLLKGAVRWAAAAGDLEALDALSLAPGFEIESALDGFTALHAAVIGGQRDVVLRLCQRGADVHALKKDGWDDTALHYAAARGDMAIAKILLAYGADPSPVNAFGATPAEMAKKRRHQDLADYLNACDSGKVPRPLPRELEGWKPLDRAKSGSIDDTSDIESGSRKLTKRPLNKEEDAAWRAAMARARDGLGTEGTRMKPFTKLFRFLAVLMQTACLLYLAWRGMRSLVPYPAGDYAYSIIFYLLEISFMPLSFVFVGSLWNTIDRSARWIGDMLPKEKLPQVDVYVVRHSEDLDVPEPTVIAALNMNWPGDKLTVHILDDGADKEVLKMVRRLRYQLTCMKREARLVYVARRRVHGVPHHAKAGNINHAILRSQGHGEYIMVLDTDMIAHPDFLQRTIGHFYRRSEDGSGWVQKKRTAFIQTPQDFWNVPPSDPMVHCARFFYGPMLQGRDGIDATPCCGTGVVFSRTSLVSIGGQSYGSITEDYNTSMTLFASGFSSMFLNERLVYGMAPEGLIDVFKQRQRWAMGAMQILFKDNPLKKTGLTFIQSILFYEAAAYHFLAIPTVLMCLVPFSVIFFGIAPVTVFYIWEFAAAFGAYFLLNRLTMWVAARGIKGADIELWRGWQMWIWLAPNHIISIWKVIKSETWLGKLTKGKGIDFKVTKKDRSSRTGPAPPEPTDIHALWKTFRVTWYFVLYDLLFIGAIVYTAYAGITNKIDDWILIINFASLFWAALNCWCTWTPVSTLLPRVETPQGWRIQWKAFLPGITLETALSGFGVTSLTIERTATLPSATIGPAPTLFGSGKRSSGVAVENSGSMKDSTINEDATINTSGSMAKYKSGTLVPKRGRLSPHDTGRFSPAATTRASSGRTHSGNFGRVAAPLRSAASLQASALLTGTILPERQAHSSAASRQPSLLAVAPGGDFFPAPAGSMPYDILPNVHSLERGLSLHRRNSLLSADQQLQLAAEQAMKSSNAATGGPLSPAISLHRQLSSQMDRAKPAWMAPTIEEDASYHASRVSYSGPYGQAMREAATAEAGDVIAAAAAKLMTVTEGEEDVEAEAAAEESNPFAGYNAFNSESDTVTGDNTRQASRQGSAMLRAALACSSEGIHELAALAALTGDFSALQDLAPVSNSPFLAADIQLQQQMSALASHRLGSTALSSPQQPPSPPSHLASPRHRRVSFDVASPFMQADGPKEPFVAPKQIPADSNSYLDQSIRIDGVDDSIILNESLILREQAALDGDFLSPFAAVAGDWQTKNSHSGELATPVHHRQSGVKAALKLETAPSSAAQMRVRAASQQLLDIAATLSPGASAALRTDSVFVVPVLPASVFDHSIASKPCFEASPPAPRDYTYLIVSFLLVMGFVACAIAEFQFR